MKMTAEQHQTLVLFFLLDVLLVVPAILGCRMIPRLLLEMMAVCNRHLVYHGKSYNLVVYGANSIGTLFVKQLGSPAHKDFEHANMLGFIDDNNELQGYYVYGQSVLGGFKKLEELASDKKLHKIVLTFNLDREKYEHLLKLSKKHNISISKWKIVETPLASRTMAPTPPEFASKN